MDKVFLQRKISNKDVYVNYSAVADDIKDAVKLYGDLTTLK